MCLSPCVLATSCFLILGAPWAIASTKRSHLLFHRNAPSESLLLWIALSQTKWRVGFNPKQVSCTGKRYAISRRICSVLFFLRVFMTLYLLTRLLATSLFFSTSAWFPTPLFLPQSAVPLASSSSGLIALATQCSSQRGPLAGFSGRGLWKPEGTEFKLPACGLLQSELYCETGLNSKQLRVVSKI